MARRQGFLVIAVLAIVVPIAINWSEAQKTVSSSSRRTSSWSAQDQQQQPNYGAYSPQQSTRQQSSAVAAPANKRTQSSYSRTQSSYQSSASAAAPVQSGYQDSSAEASEADAEPASYGSVAGKPGTDFPAFTQVPKTSFTCDGLPYEYGMYADEETGCQAFHLCYNGRRDSFLCGPGTVFNQRILHCDYWYSVDCGKSSQYYSSNAYMGSSQPEPGPAQASGSAAAPSSSRPQSVYGGYQPQSSVQSFSRTKGQAQPFRPPVQQQQQSETQEETNY